MDNDIGDFGRMCLTIAVPGMPEDWFFFAKVKGLVYGEDSSKYGCVYFSRTRCMKGLPGKEKETLDDDYRPINAWTHYFINVFRNDRDKNASCSPVHAFSHTQRHEGVMWNGIHG